MILGWIVVYLLISLLLGLAAAAAERWCRLSGRAGRWPWAAAMIGSVLIPELPLPSWAPAATIVGRWASATSAITFAFDESLAALLTAAFLLSGALLAIVALGTGLVRRHWRAAEVQGERCLITPNTGPAAVGLFGGKIVLPEWMLQLDRDAIRLVLTHEREHLRAGDPRILLAGLLLLILLPWNVPLWWQWRRLRRAVELDCDARVLRRTQTVRPYAELLLALGARDLSLAGAARLASRSDLHHRLHAMTAPTPTRRRGEQAMLASAVVALAAVAFALSGLMCVWCEPL